MGNPSAESTEPAPEPARVGCGRSFRCWLGAAVHTRYMEIKKADKMYEKMKEYHLPRFSNKLYFKIQLANVN